MAEDDELTMFLSMRGPWGKISYLFSYQQLLAYK
jgi:hypothetical protein